MNVEKLRAVKDAILAEPRKFDMGVFFQWSPDTAPCGTTGCIAGWAMQHEMQILGKDFFSSEKFLDSVMSKKKELSLKYGLEYPEEVDYAELGQAILELTSEQARELFYDENWPEEFRERWIDTWDNSGHDHAAFRKQLAQIAADRIEYMIETGK
jgi:hypothetical protein